MSETSAEAHAPSGALRALLSLAWPVVLARATQSVIGFCDALMVSPLGEEPLAAATTGAMNTFAFMILPMGVVFIVQSFASQLRGRGEVDALPRYAWYGLGLALLSGLFALPFLPYIPQLLAHLDYTPGVQRDMSAYLTIRLLSVAPVMGIEALGNWYGGLGNTRPAMLTSVLAMVINVLGCYVLITPHWGLPGYGVAGSAWAAVIATTLAFIAIFVGFLWDQRRQGKSPWPHGLKLGELWRMLRFGLPSGINWFLEFAAFILYLNAVVGHLGTTVLAAFNVVMQFNSVAFMPAFGLSTAGAIMVGEAIGRKRHDEVWPLVRLTGIVAMAWMGALGIVYVTLGKPLLAWFGASGQNPAHFLELGALMLMMSALWQLFDAIGLTLSEALRAAGDTTFCMVLRFVIAWFVFVPLAWYFVIAQHGGVVSVMTAMIVYLALLAVGLGARFASGKWRNIDLVGKEAQLV
jgi:MATE family multidrug resistance protein